MRFNRRFFKACLVKTPTYYSPFTVSSGEGELLLTYANSEIDNYVIIASLKSKPMCKLINRITRFASFDIGFTSQGLPGKLDIKRHSPTCSVCILYIQYPLRKERTIANLCKLVTMCMQFAFSYFYPAQFDGNFINIPWQTMDPDKPASYFSLDLLLLLYSTTRSCVEKAYM